MSEETEVYKGIEWLKNEVNKLPLRLLGFSILKQREEYAVNKDDVLELINQLDEKEVLSQEWLDNNSIYASSDGVTEEYVHVKDLQNLLVPKQELPAVPQFVANYIEEGKDLGCDLGTAMTVQTEVLKDIRNYIKNNEELFARAWLDGFTIKKEQKYYARIKGWENVTTGSEAYNWVYFKEKDTVGISKAVENKYQDVSFTKYDWNSLGINEYNADFFKS